MAGAGNLQMGENLSGDEFIDKNPAMLRVILELDDVIVAVVGFQQMGLRAAPHLPNEPARIYRHTICGKNKIHDQGASIDARRNEVRCRRW